MVPSVFNIFLSAALFILPTLAADATVGTQSNAVNYGTGGSIIGLIVLILDIIVFGKCTLSLMTDRISSDR